MIKSGATMSKDLLKEYIGLVVEGPTNNRHALGANSKPIEDIGNIKSRLGYAIDQYTGMKVAALEVYPDPHVEGTYAARAQWSDENGDIVTQDFLVKGVKRGGSIDPDSLEEVEFNSWPPKSR